MAQGRAGSLWRARRLPRQLLRELIRRQPRRPLARHLGQGSLPSVTTDISLPPILRECRSLRRSVRLPKIAADTSGLAHGSTASIAMTATPFITICWASNPQATRSVPFFQTVAEVSGSARTLVSSTFLPASSTPLRTIYICSSRSSSPASSRTATDRSSSAPVPASFAYAMALSLPVDGMPHPYVLSLTLDSMGHAWTGTKAGGLAWVHQEHATPLTGEQRHYTSSRQHCH